MSTTSSSKGEKLAKKIDRETNRLIAILLAMINAEPNLSFLSKLENSSQESKLKEFFYSLTVGMLYFGAYQFSGIYQVDRLAVLDETAVRDLKTVLDTRLDGFLAEGRLLSTAAYDREAGYNVNDQLASELAYSPANINLLRKAADFTAMWSANEGIYQAGELYFPKKRADATIDNKTTDLCRNRMDGQIRNWNEPFVDPISGSQWQHPPFIGGQLSPKELFHYCRTVMTPAE